MSLYKDASLVMIPTAYKDGKLYSIRPTDGSGDFTFSRGSNLAATRVASSGYIEKGRENLLLQSNTFDTTWTLNNASVSGGQAGYDGTNDAWELQATSTSSARVQQFESNTGVQSLSIYAKAGTANFLVLEKAGTNGFYIYFDVFNGSVGNSSGNIDASITSVGGGWYRCEASGNPSASTKSQFYVCDANGSTAVTNGATIYIQDAQLEAGLVATDYIETGASTAQAGILEDMPRLDYSGGASCPALLLEPQRTNSLIHSEYFGGLTIQELTAEYNSIVSPSGFQDAVKFTDNTNNARHRILKEAFASNQNDPSTCSVFAKKGTARYAFLTASNGNQVCTIIADLEDGLITHEESATSATHKDIEDYGNGWYRITLAIAGGNSTTSRYWQCGISPSAVPTNYIGNIPTYSGSNQYLYFYGGQQELNSSYPTSYIPTYGSSVTRSLDSCLATSVSDLIGQTQGTFYWEGALEENPSGANMQFSLSDGTTSQQIKFVVSSSSTYVSAEVKNGGVQQFYNNHNIDAKANRKYAIAYKANDFAFYIDGTQIATDTSGSIPACTKISFDNGVGANNIHGVFNNVILFPTRLTNDELASLTTL